MHIPSTNIWTLLKDALVHVINFKLNDLTEFLFQCYKMIDTKSNESNT